MRPFGIKHLSWLVVGAIAVGGLIWVDTRKASRPDSIANQVSAITTAQENSGRFPIKRAAPDVATKPPVTPVDSRPATTAHADVASGGGLSDRADGIVKSGTFDLSIVKSIQALPQVAQPIVVTKLAESPHPAMRNQALLILREFPAELGADGMRKLVGDKNPEIAMQAAAYLASKANDVEARALLLKDALDADPLVATPAVQALGVCRGDDVEEALLKLLQNVEEPQSVLLAAIAAAGAANATKCVPALVRLLDDTRPGQRHETDTGRVCDVAAANLEEILGMHRLPVGGYFTSPIKERDDAIVAWKNWAAQQAARPDPNPKTSFADKLLSAQLALLAKDTTADERQAIKLHLKEAFHTDFCLGNLPGVTTLVEPSVRDQWRIMKATGEDSWFRYTGYWQELAVLYERQFLTSKPSPPNQPDEQAATFIAFAGTTNMPKIWIWSFCRDFAVIWPKSAHALNVAAAQERIVAALAKERMKVVLHGRIAVAEPIPPPPVEHPTAVAEGYGAITDALAVNPSSWELHRAAVAYFAGKKSTLDVYHKLTDFSRIYPGNEVPFIAAAAYELRVRKRLDRGLDYANRALILNEANAKAYAIRGMLRVTLGKESDAVLATADLKRAYELDLSSLGDEPETHAAIAFLIGKTLEAKNAVEAKEYLKTLGGLRAFGAVQPFEGTETYVKLAKAAEAAGREAAGP